jgi:hypothetical protein
MQYVCFTKQFLIAYSIHFLKNYCIEYCYDDYLSFIYFDCQLAGLDNYYILFKMNIEENIQISNLKKHFQDMNMVKST